MKTVMLLYLFLLIACFDLHAQYPILSPFAVSLGATPMMLGLLLGAYAIAHIPGNLLAGRAVDRFGSRPFISVSLILAGIILLAQAFIQSPEQLLLTRIASGFVIAFLSPACQALLMRSAANKATQGSLMAGSGIVHMLASVAAPGLAALYVAQHGFSNTFLVLGSGLVVTGISAQLLLPKSPPYIQTQSHPSTTQKQHSLRISDFAIPFAVAYSQAVLYYELPLRGDVISSAAIHQTGIEFALISMGAVITLSMLFLNRLPAMPRMKSASLALAVLYFILAMQTPIAFSAMLVLIGMAKGIIYPAIAMHLSGQANMGHLGRVFAYLSVSYSLGAFLGPLIAAQTRTFISPYFTVFLLLGTAVLWLSATFDNCQRPAYQG